MRKSLSVRLAAAVLALMLTLGCVTFAAAENEKTVNIGVTSSVSTLNPLLIDATDIVKYALELEFLPLVDMNRDMEFVPMLAESITTDDNLTFTITLREGARWSDGEPITARDVLFTFLLITSPEAGDAYLNQYTILGTDDAGHAEAGAAELEGVKIVDERTVAVTLKWPTALSTFAYNFGMYLFILPEHVLKDVPRDQLLGHDWFNHPDVISGPYFLSEFDLNHYVRYTANGNYFLGAPKIKYLNLNVLDSAQLLAGLQAGEIDLIQPTMGAIPVEDYEAVRGLPGVSAMMSTPVTNQSVFINTQNVTDVRIRQALLYGMDRETVLNELIRGNGELIDGFICTASPLWSDIGVTAYDPAKARELIAEAKADGVSADLTWYAWSDDAAFANGVAYIAALFEELGLHIDVKTVDLASLMTVADEGSFDVMSVQYTYLPVDPYTDVNWLLSADGWTRWSSEATDAALFDSQMTTDPERLKNAWAVVNRAMQEEVPMICAYVLSTMGVVSDRLTGAVPDVYGTFVNVHEWDVR